MKIATWTKNKIKATFLWQIYLAEKNKKSISKKASDKCKVIYNIRGKGLQFEAMLLHIREKDLCENDFFYYSIDENCIIAHNYRLISNLSIDYSKIVDNGLCSLVNTDITNDISKQNNCLLKNVISFADYLKQQFVSADGKYTMRHAKNFEKMLHNPADSLEDAFQRILLWNQFFWQSQHNLLGLGRLDKILWDSYCCGKKNNEDALEVIKIFLQTIHKYYDYKSAALRGDTGQMIILGGLEPDGSYFFNELSILFLKAVRELHLPDPKFIVRVSRNMPEELLREAVLNIASGLGNPLLSNDDVIIPCMEKFYGDTQVAYNYVTTACWAPVAYGNAISQCNLSVGEFTKPFFAMMKSETMKNITTFEDFLKCYCTYLSNYWSSLLEYNDTILWEQDVLLTFFVDGCVQKNKDVSQGGAQYNDYGVQSIGLSNVVNSLYYIKKYAFESGEISLEQVKNILESDYEQENIWLLRLQNEAIRFGNDNTEILEIANTIIECSVQSISRYRNRFGGKTKMGLSSPSFITSGNRTAATFDGRKRNEPLGVQISSDKDVSYTELMRFASKLKYDAVCSNGNVVDLIITQNIMENQFEKIVSFIRSCINMGIYQIQFNVVSYKSLVDAKHYPEKYKNLIVRVWGFNAYFNDLPEEYKDLLIERAKNAERGI